MVFLISYVMLDVADARWFIPRMRPVCNGEITDKQVRACSGWIKKINNKEQNDVRVIKRGLGKLYRDITPDANGEWNRTLDAFGREPNKK